MLKLLLPGMALLAAACTTAVSPGELADMEWPRLKKVAADEPRDPMRRVSLGGFDYGPCFGITLAVILVPEPCDAAGRVEEPREPARHY
jgi:hypothetical protein